MKMRKFGLAIPGLVLLAAFGMMMPAPAAAKGGFHAVYGVHAAAFRMGYRFLKKRIGKTENYCAPDSEVISFRVVTGGGMRGGFDRTEIEKISPERARITRDVREWHSAPQHISVYEADISFLKKIDEIFRKRVDYRLEDAPYPEYRVLDAPDTSYYFRCSDRKTWSVSTARVLPGSFLSAMKEVRALVDDGIKSGTAVRDEVICSEENHCQKDGKF